MQRNKQIFIDLTSLDLNRFGGLRSYTCGLVDGIFKLDADVTLIATSKNINEIKERFYGMNYVILRTSVVTKVLERFARLSFLITKSKKLFHRIENFYGRELKKEIDVYNSVVIFPASSMCLKFLKNAKTFYMFHDLQHMVYPKNFSWKEKLYRITEHNLNCEIANVKIASSEFMVNEAVRILSLDKSEFETLAEGNNCKSLTPKDIDKLRQRREVRSANILFYPAQFWKHKNHYELILAIKHIIENSELNNIELILCGKDYGTLQAVMYAIARNNLTEIITIRHDLSDVEIMRIYESARVVFALGQYESSCIPIREAAAVGCEIVCLNIPPNLEIQTKLDLHVTECGYKEMSSAILNAITSSYTNNHFNMKNYEWAKLQSWDVILEKFLRDHARY